MASGLKLYEPEERFCGHEEVFPLTQPSGTHRYVHAKP